MLEEWRMLLTTGEASDSKESSDNDGKPQICAKPSVPKAKWSAADTQRSITKGKALADAETRANMAGTFGFSALSCLETSRAHAMKLDGICKYLPTLSGDIKEETTAMKAWRDEVRAKSKEWLGHIQIRSDMGSKLAAAFFQKEKMRWPRHLVWRRRSPSSLAAHPRRHTSSVTTKRSTKSW
jgi:hypothetical protein